MSDKSSWCAAERAAAAEQRDEPQPADVPGVAAEERGAKRAGRQRGRAAARAPARAARAARPLLQVPGVQGASLFTPYSSRRRYGRLLEVVEPNRFPHERANIK